MAYDRFDTRDERSRWSNDRSRDFDRDRTRGYSDRDERGFFERAGDEISSWFGDDEAERRRREDQMRDQRSSSGERAWERGEGRGYAASERDYNPSWRSELGRDANRERDRDFDRDRDRGLFGGRGGYRGTSGESGRQWDSDRSGYRPMTGDYGRREGFFAGTNARYDSGDYQRGSRIEDPHYHSLRQRHIDELDRDYDDYRRENQSRFESDFGSWRERRMQKRGLLGEVREHMEVIGNDDQHVGTVDRVAGDRIILTKSDPESGGAHHSLSCSEVDRVEDDRVILDCSADQARQQWRDESRNRALFEREDQGEMGPRVLDRSFEGTYR